MLSWDHIVYSTQWPIYWDRLDESKFIEKKEARIKYDSGGFYFTAFWDAGRALTAIVDYSGTFVGVQIFEDGLFEGKVQRIPVKWAVYRAKTKGDYRHLTFCQYRDYDRHYNFRGGTAYMTIYGDVPGGDRSYRGTYEQDSLEPLSISFDDCRSLFDHQAEIRELVEGIRFVEYKTARQRKRRTIKE